MTKNVDVKLFDLLSKIWEDSHFLQGMKVILKTDNEKQKMINILEAGETNTDQIILSALEIKKGRI